MEGAPLSDRLRPPVRGSGSPLVTEIVAWNMYLTILRSAIISERGLATSVAALASCKTPLPLCRTNQESIL